MMATVRRPKHAPAPHVGPHTPEMAKRAVVASPDRRSTVYRTLPLYAQLDAEALLDDASYQAAEQLADQLALAEGVNEREMGGVGGSGGGCPTQTMLDARKKLRDAQDALGGHWVYAVCAATMRRWTEAASACGTSDKTAKVRAQLALEALARHWRLYGAGARMRAVEIG